MNVRLYFRCKSANNSNPSDDQPKPRANSPLLTDVHISKIDVYDAHILALDCTPQRVAVVILDPMQSPPEIPQSPRMVFLRRVSSRKVKLATSVTTRAEP